mgnify:FL=1
MDYQNTLKYLYESAPMFQQIGGKAYKPGLETTHQLDEHFGHPHQQFKTIHIAGTNGKGSTLAFLAGIFAGAGYSVESNREHGEGRSDIVIYNDVTGQVAVFEAKYSRKLEDLEKDCQKALDQINTKMYAKEFEDAYVEVLCYGIAFYKKRCLVKSK